MPSGDALETIIAIACDGDYAHTTERKALRMALTLGELETMHRAKGE